MKIKLKDKVKEVKHCKSILSKALGLMFSIPKNKALVFHFKKGSMVDLHMFFVFYPIDVFYLDQNKIVKKKKKLYPFTIALPKKATYIIETKAGLVDIDVGDNIQF